MVALLLFVPFWQACSDAPSLPHVLEIDFSAAPEVMVGAQVVIDGNVVGELQPEGSSSIAAFGVAEGSHMVELRKDGYEAQSLEVATEAGSGKISLKAAVATWLLDGEIKNALTLSR